MRVKMTSKISTHERREIEKFTRFLALKATQVIVQSRLGEKISTSCNPHSTVSDWFNLSIHDLPDVQSEAKKALGAQMLTIGLNMCVEISLKTVEGDMLVLETWSLGIREEVDQTNRVPYSVYNRMSLLLKSLIAATRVTPAYKLSCRQGPDSYVICYRVYMGEPQIYLLGEGYQQARVGEVGTPMGTITLSVMYRTKMTISPQKTSRDCPITSMMKSDYFKPDMSPKQLHCYSNAASPDPKSPSMDIPKNKALSNHETNGQTRTEVASPNGLKEQHNINGVKENKENGGADSINGFMDLPDHKRLGAFAPSSKESDISPYLLPETSFLTVLKEDLQKSKQIITTEPVSLSATPDIKVPTESNSGGTQESNGTHSVGSDGSSSDDFVLVELKPPFADCEGNGDLGAFFRDFQMAPPLVSFAQQPTLEEQVNEIRNQLAELETSAEDLDNFVDSLCMVETLK